MWFPQTEWVRQSAAENMRPTRDGSKWIVKRHGLLIMLPVEDRVGPVDHFALHLDGDTAYVALYAWPPIPYRLLAVNVRSGKVKWSTKVWAAGGLINYDGQGWHLAELRLTRETVAVFGISEGDAYVEVFGKESGDCRCRFSTSYFDAIQPRK
jgi:hypothetical protein